MLITLKVTASTGQRYPGKKGPGLRVAWTDDLEVQGNPGLPAGTHSGISTTVRDVAAGDLYIPVPGGGDAELIQYEATYRLINVPAAGLQAGQITARGVVLIKIVGNQVQLVQPAPFAITGGTGPYKNARGEGTQQDDLRILDIIL
jgi:hypothetical protein